MKNLCNKTNAKADQHFPMGLAGNAGEGGKPFCVDPDKSPGTSWGLCGSCFKNDACPPISRM